MGVQAVAAQVVVFQIVVVQVVVFQIVVVQVVVVQVVVVQAVVVQVVMVQAVAGRIVGVVEVKVGIEVSEEVDAPPEVVAALLLTKPAWIFNWPVLLYSRP